MYERDNKHQEIAEAISPGFFGVQIDCAQCHDHPLAYEIEQSHYWGLVAFYNRGKNTKNKHGLHIKESAEGGFSKFTNALSGDALDNELTFLGKDVVIDDPLRPDESEGDEDNPDADSEETGDEPENEEKDKPKPKYITEDENGRKLDPPVPAFSRRKEFVEQVVRDNPLIARAAVNRIWALVMGRGISHPADRMNSNYEPSHPELLDWLARDFESNEFNVKRLLRNILLSKPYGLASTPAGDGADPATFAWALTKPLTAEALYRSMLIVADGNLDHESDTVLNAFQKQFSEVTPEETFFTLKQTLFLSNNQQLQRAIRTRENSNLLRLAENKNNNEVVGTAFQLAYGRQPDDQELDSCSLYLAERDDRRQQAVEQMMWALLNSAEFQYNH